ncbi:MAG: discoidin domain-containing protein, partial [Bacillota bacterium]|nr:discoidin domain-containing protein [Bacillota bacterium]
TYWHSKYTYDGTKVTSHDELPFNITVTFPSAQSISGWEYTPRTDNPAGTFKGYNIYGSADGTNFTKIFTGTFQYGTVASANKPSSAGWKAVSVKAIKIEVTDSEGGYGSATEIKFLTGGTAVSAAETTTQTTTTQTEQTGSVDRSGWTVTVNSEMGGGASIKKILDGDQATFWHSKYVEEGTNIVSHDTPPYEIEITLPQAMSISGLSFLPRQDALFGLIFKANIYLAANDTDEYFPLIKDMDFPNTKIVRNIDFTANMLVKKIKLEVTSSNGGYGTMAEFNIIPAKDTYKTISYEDYQKTIESNRLYKIDGSLFKASYDGAVWATHTAEYVFDGSEFTFWQTDSATENQVFHLKVDLNQTYKIKEFKYTPRQTPDLHGGWLKFNVWVSTDGKDYNLAAENIKWNPGIDIKTYTFEKEIEFRYIDFEISGYNQNRAACAELDFYQTKSAHENNKEEYVLKVGSNVIKSTIAGVTKETTLDVAPYIQNGSTLIPIRGLLELMGATVSWAGDTQTIGIQKGTTGITLQIWNTLVYVDHPRYGHIKYTLRSAPRITNNRTFIPLRFVSEQLGYDVKWDGATQTITISKALEG